MGHALARLDEKPHEDRSNLWKSGTREQGIEYFGHDLFERDEEKVNLKSENISQGGNYLITIIEPEYNRHKKAGKSKRLLRSVAQSR